MKKFLCLLLGAALLMPVFAACSPASDVETDGVTDPVTSPETAGETEPKEDEPFVREGFVHPGLLHTEESLELVRDGVENGYDDYKRNWAKLRASEFCQIAAPRPTAKVIRGGNGDNVAQFYRDVARAYQCALVWQIEGDEAYGDCARDILNAWSATLREVSGNADRYLASGLYGYEIANAAELMRDYPGFELEQMQDMLLNVFYKPLCERFLISNEFGKDHNDAYITNYWANWDLCNMAATIAIGIFCDREDIYDIGIEYFKYGKGNGSIYNAIPYLFEEDELAQWQESGRDQGHAGLGIGLMATCCEMAYNQGDDLYGWADNRFMYAAEYVARYNNGENVPFEPYEWASGQKGDWQAHTGISSATRGETRPIWAMIYNHYHNRLGYDMPNVKATLDREKIEGGPGGHGSTFDQLGFGTLLYNDPEGSGSSARQLGGNIEDGVYKIALYSGGLYLTANDDGSVTVMPDGNEGQEWQITHIGSGQYKVVNVKNGMVLAVAEGIAHSGAEFLVEDYYGWASQKIIFTAAVKDSYRIFAAHATKAMTASGGKEGAKIIQKRYEQGFEQMWKLEWVG